MKRTCLQKNTNTDIQNSCEFPAYRTGWHPVEIMYEEKFFNPRKIQPIQRFVQMKQVFIAVFAVLFTITLQAQSKIELSFTGSPSLNWLGSDLREVQKGQPILGYDFGVDADFFLVENGLYSISTGILIASAGGELEFQTTEAFRFGGKQLQPPTKVKYFLRYVEIPALLKMKTSQFHRTTFWGVFGLSGMVNIQAKGSSNDLVLDKNTINDEVNMFNMALNVGLGFDYDLGGNNALTVGLIFKNGLMDITSNANIDDRCIMNTLRLKLGIVF